MYIYFSFRLLGTLVSASGRENAVLGAACHALYPEKESREKCVSIITTFVVLGDNKAAREDEAV